jgi:hypothetical protein
MRNPGESRTFERLEWIPGPRFVNAVRRLEPILDSRGLVSRSRLGRPTFDLMAGAVRQVEIGLAALLGFVLGLTAIVYGAALLIDGRAWRWLAVLALAAGLVTATSGVMMAYAGFSDAAMTVSMIGSVGVWVWVMGWGRGWGAPVPHPCGYGPEQHGQSVFARVSLRGSSCFLRGSSCVSRADSPSAVPAARS